MNYFQIKCLICCHFSQYSLSWLRSVAGWVLPIAKRKELLQITENLQMVNGKGKYVPTKGSNIQEMFAGIHFILLTEWMPSKPVVKTEDLSQSSSMLQSGWLFWTQFSAALCSYLISIPDWMAVDAGLGFVFSVWFCSLSLTPSLFLSTCSFDEKELIST